MFGKKKEDSDNTPVAVSTAPVKKKKFKLEVDAELERKGTPQEMEAQAEKMEANLQRLVNSLNADGLEAVVFTIDDPAIASLFNNDAPPSGIDIISIAQRVMSRLKEMRKQS